MTMPGPAGNRGAPMFEDAAQATLQATRHPPVYRPPPGDYEPAAISAEDKAAAEQAAQEEAAICKYCIGLHRYPTTVACPRIAEVELNGDGSVKSAKFWPGKGWSKGRVALLEDLSEDAEDGDGG